MSSRGLQKFEIEPLKLLNLFEFMQKVFFSVLKKITGRDINLRKIKFMMTNFMKLKIEK